MLGARKLPANVISEAPLVLSSLWKAERDGECPVKGNHSSSNNLLYLAVGMVTLLVSSNRYLRLPIIFMKFNQSKKLWLLFLWKNTVKYVFRKLYPKLSSLCITDTFWKKIWQVLVPPACSPWTVTKSHLLSWGHSSVCRVCFACLNPCVHSQLCMISKRLEEENCRFELWLVYMKLCAK